MTKKRVFLFVALGLLFFYLFVLQVAAIWPFTIDDMYISLRYAKNWEHGNGLLWNIGEQPVEGYSNFLFVCLAALAIKLGLDPVFILKLMGAAGLVVTSGALYALSRLWFSTALSFIPVLWLLFYRDEIVWVSSGLETTCYQALLLLSVYALLRGLGYKAVPQQARGDSQLGYWLLSGVLLALAGLTRPEGGVVGVLFFMIAYFNLREGRQSRYCFAVTMRTSSRACEGSPKHSGDPSQARDDVPERLHFVLGSGVFALIYGTYFLWRWHYYGLLMPNTVYCKGFATSHWLVLDKCYLKLVWPFLLLGMLGVFGKKNKITGYDRRFYFLWVPSLIYLIFLAKADPVSAMAQRLFLPAFVLFLPLALLGIQNIIYYFIQRIGSSRALLIGAASVWVGILCLPISGLEQLAFFTRNPLAGEQLRMEVTDWLKLKVSPDDRIVLGDSGMLPYLIPARFEDSYCLNNKRMGNESYGTMFDALCQRMLRQKPAVIIVASLVENGKIIYAPTDKCLNTKLTHSIDYRKSKLFQTSATESRYRYEIYTLRD